VKLIEVKSVTIMIDHCGRAIRNHNNCKFLQAEHVWHDTTWM